MARVSFHQTNRALLVVGERIEQTYEARRDGEHLGIVGRATTPHRSAGVLCHWFAMHHHTGAEFWCTTRAQVGAALAQETDAEALDQEERAAEGR